MVGWNGLREVNGMATPKNFYMKFNTQDWVSGTVHLSGITKAVLIDIIAHANHSPERGKLVRTMKEFARMVGAELNQASLSIDELCDEAHPWLMRRSLSGGKIELTYPPLADAAELSSKRSIAGKLGGNPRLVKQNESKPQANPIVANSFIACNYGKGDARGKTVEKKPPVSQDQPDETQESHLEIMDRAYEFCRTCRWIDVSTDTKAVKCVAKMLGMASIETVEKYVTEAAAKPEVTFAARYALSMMAGDLVKKAKGPKHSTAEEWKRKPVTQ